MKGKLIKENNGYTLFVDGKVFGDTDGHQLKSITNRLSIKNCQIIELDCDLDDIKRKVFDGFDGRPDSFTIAAVERTIQIMVELMGDNRFSEDDMLSFESFVSKWYDKAKNVEEFTALPSELLVKWKSLQKTEWEVEIIEFTSDDLKSINNEWHKLGEPKLDADGYIILKRI